MSNSSIEDVVIPTQVIVLLVELLKEQGNTEQAILDQTGLTLNDLKNQSTFIRYDQALLIMDNALQLYPNKGLGLLLGQRQRITSWGLLGFAMLSARDLGQALHIAQEHYPSASVFYDLDFSFGAEESSIKLFTPYTVGHLLPTLVEEFFSGIFHVFPMLTGVPFRPSEIHVSYSAPMYSHLYEELFNCPIHYSSPTNQLLFDSKQLQQPVLNADPVSVKIALQLCQESILRQNLSKDLTVDIRRIFIRSPGNYPTMEQVAGELNMSTRTLRRHLVGKQTTFQALSDLIRKDLAIDYLKNPHLHLDQIAELVGFSEYNNFRKAFKRWTGHPPSHYREAKSTA